MDGLGRRVAFTLLTLAVLGGATLPWMACARDSSSPLVAMTARAAFTLGHVVCHQRPERSFFSCGRQWPVCGRCAGLYFGAALGAVLALAFGRRLPRLGDTSPDRAAARWRRILVAAALPTAALWAIEVLGILDPGTIARFAGALPLGIGGAGWLAAVAHGDLR